MARLDRLGPAKEVAQIGAVIGREFSHALLAAVVRKSEAELGSALDRLMTQVWFFGRVCLRTRAICSNMLWYRTRPMARCCASPAERFMLVLQKRLKTSSPDCRIARLLARHSTEAGLIEKAAGLWGKAGLRSLERSALVEAIEQLTAPSTRLQRWLLRQHCVASRSDFRSRS